MDGQGSIDARLLALPPDAPGMPWARYEAMLWERWRAEAAQATFDRAEFDHKHPVQTARDRYGWRGLTGTSYLGPKGSL